MWGGRFRTGADQRVQRYTSSLETDRRLARHDVRGSRAHVRMLAAQGIIGPEDADAILTGLAQIQREVAEGSLALRTELEDVHMQVEARLAEIIGEERAGRLHTGRSRNDQVALDMRLFVREAIVDSVAAVRGLQGALLELAERYRDVFMPGYTHLQRAQPVLLSHHLLAYFEMLDRDAARMIDGFQRTDEMPLGSAALAGAGYPLDREAVARELGFARVSRNSMDAVSDRDFVLEFLAAAAICMVHLSRLCEELVLWSSAEFGYIRFDDSHATGSSIMPQKRNPDVAELARAKTGRVVGHLMAQLMMLKGLPLAYNRDLQEDKPGLFDTVDTLESTLHVLRGTLETASVDGERARAAVTSDPFILATDYADYLARKGLPFREAHGVIGALVQRCEGEGRALHDLTLDELRAAHPLFGEDAVGVRVEEALAARDVAGGTAPQRVAAALNEAGERLAAARRALPAAADEDGDEASERP